MLVSLFSILHRGADVDLLIKQYTSAIESVLLLVTSFKRNVEEIQQFKQIANIDKIRKIVEYLFVTYSLFLLALKFGEILKQLSGKSTLLMKLNTHKK